MGKPRLHKPDARALHPKNVAGVERIMSSTSTLNALIHQPTEQSLRVRCEVMLIPLRFCIRLDILLLKGFDQHQKTLYLTSSRAAGRIGPRRQAE